MLTVGPHLLPSLDTTIALVKFHSQYVSAYRMIDLNDLSDS